MVAGWIALLTGVAFLYLVIRHNDGVTRLINSAIKMMLDVIKMGKP